LTANQEIHNKSHELIESGFRGYAGIKNELCQTALRCNAHNLKFH